MLLTVCSLPAYLYIVFFSFNPSGKTSSITILFAVVFPPLVIVNLYVISSFSLTYLGVDVKSEIVNFTISASYSEILEKHSSTPSAFAVAIIEIFPSNFSTSTLSSISLDILNVPKFAVTVFEFWS